MNNKAIKEVIDVIDKYSEVYGAFEGIQKRDKQVLLPEFGDQKTGLIGEFYSRLYLLNKGFKDVKYAPQGSKYDIIVGDNNMKIQVKTANTFYSKTNTLSPIKKGWDFLYLISLNAEFKPNGFWIQKYSKSIFKGKEHIPSAKIRDPRPEKIKCIGSKIFDFSNNLSNELNEAINKFL